MNNFSDAMKLRLWWPSVKKMRYFEASGLEYVDGKCGVFFPSVEDTVFLGPGTSMRFTGKKDCEGNELYEGDIIQGNHGVLMVIRYGLNTAYCPADDAWMDSVGFYAEAAGYPQMPIGPTEDYAERVGNIYENPDMLCKNVVPYGIRDCAGSDDETFTKTFCTGCHKYVLYP